MTCSPLPSVLSQSHANDLISYTYCIYYNYLIIAQIRTLYQLLNVERSLAVVALQRALLSTLSTIDFNDDLLFFY